MKSIGECKEFLALFMGSNKAYPLEFPAYDMDVDADEHTQQLAAWETASNPNSWEQESQCSFGEKEFIAYGDTVIVQTKNSQEKFHEEKIKTSAFSTIRVFNCASDKFDDRIKYILLEDKQGTLFLGEDLGN